MKITICGSTAFYDKMLEAKKQLEALGHSVEVPPRELTDESGKPILAVDYYPLKQKAINDPKSWVWDRKQEVMKKHLEKVADSHAILVLNYEKNSVPGYIGGNTLMEMAVAFHLGKKIFLLHEIPNSSFKEEVLGMKPTVLHGELNAFA